MTDEQTWREAWMAHFARHLASALTPLLPPGHEFVATGRQITLMVRREASPLQVAVSYELPVPAHGVVLGPAAVEQLLGEVQDETTQYLARTWPDTGAALHRRAELDDGAVLMSFEARGGDPASTVRLEPFQPPPNPAATRIAG